MSRRHRSVLERRGSRFGRLRQRPGRQAEKEVRKEIGVSFISNRLGFGRREDRVAHPVEQFLVGRDDGGEDAVQFGLAVFEEIIRAKPDAAAHRLYLASLVVPITMIDQARLMETLHETWRGLEIHEGFVNRAFPFDLRHIGADDNSATPPPQRRKAAHLNEKVPLFLAEFAGLAPILDLETRNDRVLRHGRWIERPAVGNDFLQFQKIFFAEFAPPEFPERLHPEKREPHLFLEERFDWRRDFQRTGPQSVEKRRDTRQIWEIKQLEETINVATRLWFVGFGIDDAPFVPRIF